MSKSRGAIVQRHHITYEPERVVYITKGEHLILTRMQWFCKKIVSKGFITALRQFIKDNASRSEDLKEHYRGRN